MDDYDEEDDLDAVAFVHAEEDEEEVDGESMDEEGEEEEEDMEEDGAPDEADGLAEVLNGGGMRLPDAIDDDDDDESDAEDHEIRPTDAVVLVATTEDEEYSSIEVHVYEEESGALYVHHDIALPAFPLCLAWGDCPPSLDADGKQTGVGSFVAVGTFQPGIEIWDLDIIDPLEPVAVLGGEMDVADGGLKKKKKKGKRAGPALAPGSHEGAVMSLDWNRQHRQVSPTLTDLYKYP
jgi:periodic tryptophan protein 1